MSNRSTPPIYTSRHERRLAERAAGKSKSSGQASPGRRLSPFTLLTALALIIGVGVIAFVALTAGRVNVADLKSPDLMTPLAQADGRALGAKTAPVTIDLWADFQCPGCQAFTDQVQPMIDGYANQGQVRLIFHDMAFLGPESIDAAVAARAADAQGKFWTYHDYLYANQGTRENGGTFSRNRLVAIAQAVGLDVPSFEKALDDPVLKAAVTAEVQIGRAAGVTTTPTLFVNGRQTTNYDPTTVLAAIKAALAATPSASPAASGATP